MTPIVYSPKEKKRYKSVAAKQGSIRGERHRHIERTSVIHDMSRCIVAWGGAYVAEGRIA